MSISYSGLINYGKVTLPSVESFGTNMNILKDPPKSIMTRRKDKVGDNLDITNQISDAGDRICEAISTYARGVNPSISVEYNNTSCANGQAYLPYRIMDKGAFRPPIISQDKLLPLSRLPRNVTSIYTQKKNIHHTKRIETPQDDYRSIKQNTIKACIRPTASFKIEKPIEVPYRDITNSVKDSVIKTSANSGLRTMDITTQEVKIPTKEIDNNTNLIENVRANKGTYCNVKYADLSNINTYKYIQDALQGNINTNKGTYCNVKYADQSNTNTDKYIQDALQGNINTNKGTYCNVKYADLSNINTDKCIQDALYGNINTNKNNPYSGNKLEDILEHQKINQSIKTSLNTSCDTLKTGYTKEDSITRSKQLNKNVTPITEAYTNKNDNRKYVTPKVKYYKPRLSNRPIAQGYSNKSKTGQNKNTFQSREVTLKPTINLVDGYEGRGTNSGRKNINRDISLKENHKTRRNKKVTEMFQSRF